MTDGGIIVRDAGPDDIERIVEWNICIATESEQKQLDRDTLTAGVHRGFAHPELCRYFIAELDGTPVGTTMLTYELTDWRCGVIWWLQSVYVEAAARERGVFSAIYAHIHSLAETDDDARGLRLYVRFDNQRARNTYQAMGMSPSGYEVFEHEFGRHGV
jgi:GNAT superfamily N-acetyltransferase